MQKVRISTDCANVVRNIQGPGMGPYGHNIKKIKAGVASFTEAEAVHESRKSNGEAHSLAKSSIYNSVGRHVLLLSPPNGVCSCQPDI